MLTAAGAIGRRAPRAGLGRAVITLTDSSTGDEEVDVAVEFSPQLEEVGRRGGRRHAGAAAGARGARGAFGDAQHARARPRALVQRGGELPARLARQRVLDAELRRARRRRRGAARPCGPGRARRRWRRSARRGRPPGRPASSSAKASATAGSSASLSRDASPSAANPGGPSTSVQRLVALAALGQQARQRDGGVRVGGLELERAAQVLLAAGLRPAPRPRSGRARRRTR